MSTEDNKALARRGFEEVFNQKNLAVLDEFVVADFTFHSASRTIQGREAFRQFLTMFLTAFPDLSLTIEDWSGIVPETYSASQVAAQNVVFQSGNIIENKKRGEDAEGKM